MTTFKNILVHVDTHDAHSKAFELAIGLAKQNGARIKIVDNIPDFSWPVQLLVGGAERTIELITGEKSGRLNHLADEARDHGVETSIRLLDGRLSVGIVREVVQDKHDLVIKQAKGRGSRRASFFGSTATRLFRKCPCPVLATGPEATWPCRHVAAAVDVTPDDAAHANLNHTIIETASRFGVQAACPVDVVSSWSVYGEEILKNHMREGELAQLREHAEADARRRLDELADACKFEATAGNVRSLHGDAGVTIAEFVQKAGVDLLVMGTVGRAGLSGLLIGNTAERILDRVQCSVLALKPEGFVTPIR